MTVEAKYVAAVTILMGFWWLTEAIPIPVTSLIPIILFPLLGIKDAASTTASYGDKNIFLFMGGFFIAIAIEKCGLHRRIALNIIAMLGKSKKTIILGFMIASSFLSMWISNTATTLMMLPIGAAVITSIGEIFEENKNQENFNKALMLGIAYAASIGGISTLIGSPPNLIFAGVSKTIFPDSPEITFTKWITFGIVIVIIFLPICWYILTGFLFKIKSENTHKVKTVVREKLKSLGKIKREEKLVLIIFILTSLGWIFRRRIDLEFFSIPGWSELLNRPKFAHDSTVAIAGAILLFLIPGNWKKKEFLLNWRDAKKIPWGILILFGGGIALASGFRDSGLSSYIGHSLKGLSHLPSWCVVFTICMVVTFLTEVTSNTATASIFMPILAGLAISTRIHPFLLMIPATVSASCAFMLPVATPPNAIVFSSGWIKIPDMAKTGIFLNIIGAILITAITFLITIPLFNINFNTLPVWAK